MLKYILIILLLSISILPAQVMVTLNVDSNPTPEISEWVDRNDLAILTVTNTNQALVGLEYRIKMRMLKDGAQVLETDNSTEILILDLGTETFLADQIVPYNSLQFNNSSFENQVAQTGMLPAGEYTFCVQLVDLNGDVISTPPEVCQPMIITDYQLPELLYPIAGNNLDGNLVQGTMFTWSPLTPMPPAETGIKYIVAVSEVMEGQTGSQAFTANFPVIEEEVVIGTQLMWPLDLDVPDEDQEYVWSVKPVTNNDNPYLSTNNGFVNIETFTITPPTTLVEDPEGNEGNANNEECECADGQTIDLSGISPVLLENEEENTFAIEMVGAEQVLAALTACQFQEISPGVFGTQFNNPYHPDNFEGAVFYNWNQTTGFYTADNDHVYDPDAVIPDPVPEQVLVTFVIGNTNLGTTCQIEHFVDIPVETQNEVNGNPTCDCAEATGTRPFVTLSQPEPTSYPMKLELNNILELRDYFWTCNSEWDENIIEMVIEINWNEENVDTPLNNGPFEHLFAPCDDIPEVMNVTYIVQNKFDEQEVICELVEEITVPQEFVDLNQPCTGNSDINQGDSIFAGADDENGLGEFEIVTTELEEENGQYSGTGTVYIEWMKANMLVEFEGITVDTDGDLLTGDIVATTYEDAPVYPQDWAINVVATSPWANNTAENVINYIENLGVEIPFEGLTEVVNPVQVPLGLNFSSGDQIAIVEMVFKYDKAEYNLVAAKTTPPSWNNPVQVVGFIAKNISFHPETAFEPPIERIELIEDVNIGNMNNNITFTFKAPTNSNSGCYMEWDENGFTEYGIELESSFTRDWLIPVPDDGVSRSKAMLSSIGSDWNDMLLTGVLEKSEIVDSQEMKILADSISYDMSDVRNPNSIVFPENYAGETSNLFRGFYMKQLQVELSSSWATNTGGQPTITIEEMIIDDVGLTLYGEASNVVSFPNGEVADLYASIDTVYVDIEASTFREGGMKGRIGLPLSTPDSIDNPLKYHALFNIPPNPNDENYLQLTITPTGPFYTNMLKGEMELAPTSNILAQRYEQGRKIFELNLDGSFSWENITLGPVQDINFGLDFEGVGMDYDSDKPSDKLTFDIGAWGFASPQKFLANFPVTIDNIDFKSMPSTGNEMLKGKLEILVVANLSEKIGGATQLSVIGKIEDETGSGGKKFTPKYVGTTLDSINIQADMAAVKINGVLIFRNQDPVFGDGFLGTVDATIKACGINISALAEFGNTTYGSSNRYRYWRVEGNATFPAPGIVFLPGIAFRGFGGGAFKNMNATLNNSNNYEFEPEENGFGFRALATIATTPKEETFNADVGLLGQFSQSGGLTFIGFNGDFWVGANFASRNKAKVNGNVAVTYDFPQKHFMLSSNVNVNAPPITTPSPANLTLDINGKTNQWFFKFGEPANLNTVNVFNISLYEYLMFGNNIPYPGGFTNNFKNGYFNTLGSWPGPGNATGGVGSNTETGKGFALGIGFTFDAADDLIISEYNNGNKKYTLSYNLNAGAELNLSYMEYLGSCAGYNPIGINGWRAKGGLGFYGAAGAGVKKFRRNGNLKKYWNIIALKGGGWIVGEFPNPYYAAGNIEGSGDLFGIIEFDFDADFEAGQQCNNSGAGGGASVAQGDAAADMQQNLIQYVNPPTTNNFPTDMPIAVKFGLNPDEVFDVSEQQSNGTVEMRTFKMEISKSLEIENESTETWETVMMNTNQNNLGEYLYTAIIEVESAPVMNITTPLVGGGGNSSGGNNTGSKLASMPIFNMPVTNTNNTGTYSASQGFTPQNTNNLGGMLSANEILYSGATVHPGPPNNGGYSNLPPTPDPIENNLKKDRNYRFTVTATLKEWNGSTWVNAQKNNGQNVTQTITKNFRTGAIQVVPAQPLQYSF